jgi:aryl-alcohol dehydrogenase-like predicted oxidoreductase
LRRSRLGRRPGDTGLPLIHLALAFATTHPALTTAIIGPRTAEHLQGQLATADLVLEPAVLDRIDQIVPPGVALNPADAGYGQLAQTSRTGPGPGR